MARRQKDPPARPRAPRAAVSRATLLAAANRLLTEGGPSALSVRAVAAAAGTTTMAVYSRLGGKQGLVDALFREGFERMARAQEAVPRTLDAEADLRALVDTWRTAALRQPAHYQLMLGHAVPDFTPSPESQQAALVVFERLVDAVQRAIDELQLAPNPPREVAHGLFALCHGLVGLELAGVSPGAGAAERAWRAAVDTFIRGAQTMPHSRR